MEERFPFLWMFSWVVKGKSGALNDEQTKEASRARIESIRDVKEVHQLSIELGFHESCYNLKSLQKKIEKARRKHTRSYNERHKIKYMLLKQELEKIQVSHNEFEIKMNRVIREREEEARMARQLEIETNCSESEFDWG